MKRVDTWESDLRRVVLSYAGRPFVWGESDCACFAADCVAAISGVDPLAPYRGTYSGRLGATARMLFRSYRSVAQAAGAELQKAGARPIDPRAARAGDVGVTADDVLAIRLSRGFMARDKAGRFYTTPVVRAWSVG